MLILLQVRVFWMAVNGVASDRLVTPYPALTESLKQFAEALRSSVGASHSAPKFELTHAILVAILLALLVLAQLTAEQNAQLALSALARPGAQHPRDPSAESQHEEDD